jgi:alkanesulfonate monooxygenase SsuD/methylene tetrahydromethanopterin reductase-like flavin-dependent oxidoreductase (luciferase family)
MATVIEEIVAEAQAAEASGWDGCFITEHHQQEDGYLPNPLLMAGLIGMKTQRIKVGTCVLLLPLYHPVRVAEDCAVVDLATKGRLILSIGSTISTRSKFQSNHGRDAPRRRSRFFGEVGRVSAFPTMERISSFTIH